MASNVINVAGLPIVVGYWCCVSCRWQRRVCSSYNG